MRQFNLLLAILFFAACSDDVDLGDDAGTLPDNSATVDATNPNSGANANSGDLDAGMTSDGGDQQDSGNSDVGTISDSGPEVDSGLDLDAGGPDAGPADSGMNATDSGGGSDSGTTDAGTGMPDMSMSAGDCISGATGTHAVRFEWLGNGPSSRAYVGYRQNQLPDTSRWKAGAYGRSFNYNPTFGDTFLGVGGLIFQSTTFMDVELSTSGLSSIRNVTLSIFGRSYNTTASGSFSWMTFDGAGAAPSGLVANSAPYQWYSADATSAFVPGNAGVLLRISPEGPSNSLVVNMVELCFDAS